MIIYTEINVTLKKAQEILFHSCFNAQYLLSRRRILELNEHDEIGEDEGHAVEEPGPGQVEHGVGRHGQRAGKGGEQKFGPLPGIQKLRQ